MYPSGIGSLLLNLSAILRLVICSRWIRLEIYGQMEHSFWTTPSGSGFNGIMLLILGNSGSLRSSHHMQTWHLQSEVSFCRNKFSLESLPMLCLIYRQAHRGMLGSHTILLETIMFQILLPELLHCSMIGRMVALYTVNGWIAQVVLSEWRILGDLVIPRDHRSDDWLQSIGDH